MNVSDACQFQKQISPLLRGKGLGTSEVSGVSAPFHFKIWWYIDECLFQYKFYASEIFHCNIFKKKGFC